MTRFFWAILGFLVMGLCGLWALLYFGKSGWSLERALPRFGETPSAPSVVLPSLPVQKTVLENGLTILVLEDHSAPVVAAQMWVNAGSVTEGKWMGAGLSHILEHMLFKGTRTRSNSQIALAIQDQGGYVNAYTSFDRTVYHITGPATGWRTYTDVLFDAMINSTLPPEEYVKEQEVIRREFAMGYDNPDRMAWLLLFEQAYAVHPYRFPVIGHLQIYNKLTRDDVMEYYKKMYIPQNITFLVAGDVKSDEVVARVRELARDWQRGPQELPPIPPEPPQLGRREMHQESNVNLSRLYLGYKIPALEDPDSPALDVLASIAGGGRSSKLNQVLREEKGLVKSISAFAYTPNEPGLFIIQSVLEPGKRTEALRAIEEVLGGLKSGRISDGELAKARRELLAGVIKGRKTAEGLAGEVGNNYFTTRNTDFTSLYVKAVNAVTRRDLERVARKYLVDDRLTVVSLNPPGSRQKDAPTTQKAPEDRPIRKVTLSNGIRVLIKEDPRLPVVNLRVVARAGLLAETPGNNGISSLMMKTLLKGTKKRSAAQLARDADAIGAGLGTESGANSCGLSLEVLQSDEAAGFGLLEEILLHPAFAPDEIAREKEVQLAEIRSEKEQPMAVARLDLVKSLFPNHPYGMNVKGTEESLRRLTPEAVREFYRSVFVPENMVISVFGDVKTAEVQARLEKAFAGFPPSGGRPAKPAAPVTPPLTAPVLVQSRVEKAQAVLMFGFPGVDLHSPDRQALDIIEEASSDLGSRFFVRIREKMGLAYFVGARDVPGVVPGYFLFYVGTSPEKAGAVRWEMFAEIKNVAVRGLTEEEIARAKAKLLGQDKVQSQDIGALAYRCALDELYGLGYDRYKGYDQRIQSVTSPEIQNVARKYFGTENFVTVIVSPLAESAPAPAAVPAVSTVPPPPQVTKP
ncbi:MAG: pitrilysin family protein [Verrucomicrobiae bacterium]|nr:pitrilysin family protein [Verrucomicrobiae bacterium]